MQRDLGDQQWPQRRPSTEDLIKQLKGFFKRRRKGGKAFPIVLAVLFLLWLASGIYMVSPAEEGVVRRFGKMVRVTSQGLRYHLPWPIEEVDTPKVTEIKRLEIGFRTVDPGPPARYQFIEKESLMLTGDENIVDAQIIVQYKIKNAPDYLFKVKDPKEAGYPDSFNCDGSHDLKKVARFESYRGFLFGSLREDVAPLEEFLGESKKIIDMVVDQSPEGIEVLRGSSTYVYEGNWKLQAENGADGYHVSFVH